MGVNFCDGITNVCDCVPKKSKVIPSCVSWWWYKDHHLMQTAAELLTQRIHEIRPSHYLVHSFLHQTICSVATIKWASKLPAAPSLDNPSHPPPWWPLIDARWMQRMLTPSQLHISGAFLSVCGCDCWGRRWYSYNATLLHVWTLMSIVAATRVLSGHPAWESDHN